MKKLIIILFFGLLSFSLSACGQTDTANSAMQVYDDVNFSIEYPADWLVELPADFGQGIPQSTKVAFVNPQPQDGYQSNLTVVLEILPPQVNSLQYAKTNINNALKNIIEFEKIEERDILLGQEKTKLIIFKGKRSLESKSLRYLQTYLVFGQRGYTLTASTLLNADENVINKLEKMVMSFKFKSAK